ncbi:MAG TPA: hypothetical protein VFR34_14910, partial [Paracoccaceae bacterium]|nr:hypothetical protein [Paracoccaceae bacterium]
MRTIAALMAFYMLRPSMLGERLGLAGLAFAGRGLGSLVTGLRAAAGGLADRRQLRRLARLEEMPAAAAGPHRAARAGTILIVVHDMGLGGAQAVARTFARWLLANSAYDVRFVALRDGPFRPRFEAIAPTFCLRPGGARWPGAAGALRLWAGIDVRALLVNSVASGRILGLWRAETPAIAYVHELPLILERHRDALALIA